MTENERVMSPAAGRQGRAEHDVIVVGNLTVDDVVHPNGVDHYGIARAATPSTRRPAP